MYFKSLVLLGLVIAIFATDDSCKDNWKACQDLKEKGRCDKAIVIKNCPKTCENCQDGGDDDGASDDENDDSCKNIWPDNWCNNVKEKGKCSKGQGEKCKLTCEKCQDGGDDGGDDGGNDGGDDGGNDGGDNGGDAEEVRIDCLT